MNTEQLIEKHLFGKKPEKWDDEFDRIQHLSVNDVRAMLDEHAKCVLSDVSGMLPLTKEHQCFERGHAFYLVCEIDNGTSKYGDHKCSRCGHVEPFQYDYGSW